MPNRHVDRILGLLGLLTLHHWPSWYRDHSSAPGTTRTPKQRNEPPTAGCTLLLDPLSVEIVDKMQVLRYADRALLTEDAHVRSDSETVWVEHPIPIK
jgi:hypothetical protein